MIEVRIREQGWVRERKSRLERERVVDREKE